MKVSLNWIQEESNVDIKGVGVEEILRRIGSQLGAVEDVIYLGDKYKNIVTARVVSCEKHQNADKLNVCLIDDGGFIKGVERNAEGLVQVVCGAPNVRAGIVVAWLPPGSIVPSSLATDPFELSARDLRGVKSNGMLASPHELDISDDHSGILEIEGTTPPGLPLADALGLNDTVIELENKMFTHRPDCFGIIGVARELAGITGQNFKSPEWYLTNDDEVYNSIGPESSLPLEVVNEIPDLVPRFMTVILSDIKVGKSPVWLQVLLSKVGIKSINNVVDITNYMMHLTGQPMHAFDYDKLLSLSDHPSLHPRMSNPGEKLTVLGGKEVELSGEEIVISTDKQAVALAGVIGGIDAEVDENTTNIVIECATFDMYNIRRTSMKHGLFTDAVTRFNKGQSPKQNRVVLNRAIDFMSDLAGAKLASPIQDLYNVQNGDSLVETSSSFINSRLGIDLTNEAICELLNRTEINSRVEGEGIIVSPPFWRMDIENPEDIVEEVGRLHGYSNIPVELPLRSTKPTAQNRLFEFKKTMRHRLKELGANEVLTYSFVHSDLLKKVDVNPEETSHHIRNAISPDLQYLRPSILPSLMAKIRPNIKSQAGSSNNKFALFEIGKSHQISNNDEDGLPVGIDALAFIFSSDDKTAKIDSIESGYYIVKKYLDDLTNHQAKYMRLDSEDAMRNGPFQLGRSAIVTVNGSSIGMIGEFKRSVREPLKLPKTTSGFEIDLNKLMNSLEETKYVPLPVHPVSKQDITIQSPKDISYDQVLLRLNSQILAVSSESGYEWSIDPVSIYLKGDEEKQSFTFRLTVWHPNKTLTTTEVNDLIAKLSI